MERSICPKIGSVVENTKMVGNVLAILKESTSRIDAEKSKLAPIIQMNPMAVRTEFSRANTVQGPANFILESMKRRNESSVRGMPSPSQFRVLERMATYFDRLFRKEKNVDAPLIFVHGAAGTGKSFLFRDIEIMAVACERYISVSAMTGVAAGNIDTDAPVRTTASQFCYGVKPENVKIKNPTVRDKLREKIGDSVAIIIDEIGTATAVDLAAVHIQMQNLTGDYDKPFGGVATVIAGDFFQLPPPVQQGVFWKNAFFVGEKGSMFAEDREEMGIQLFLLFEKMDLVEQMRAVDDPVHATMTQNMRSGKTAGLASYLKDHRYKEVNDSEMFKDATIIAPGNPERYFMAYHIISRYATEHKRSIIRWKNEVIFKEDTQKQSIEDYIRTMGGNANGEKCISILYDLNPQLYTYYCQGYEVILTKNIKAEIGIVNGSRAILMDLSWPDRVRKDALQYIEEHSNNEIIDLPSNLVPTSVIVKVLLSEGHLKNCEPKQSLKPWDENTPVADRQVWVPVIASIQTNVRLESETNTVQFVKLKRIEYILSGMLTNYKCQSLTMPKTLISLLNRPGMPQWNDFSAVYTALTRVRRGNMFRVLYDDGDINKVSELKPNPMLLAFLQGYGDSGKWELERSLKTLPTELGEEISKAYADFKDSKNFSESVKGAKKRNAAVRKAINKYMKGEERNSDDYVDSKIKPHKPRKTRQRKDSREVITHTLSVRPVPSKNGN